MTTTGSEDPLEGSPYEAVRKLGRGAFGEVWEGRHRLLGTRHAVKIIHRDHLANAFVRDRFRLEAQAQARISSPHLVRVNDLGSTADGRPYLVMEYLVGESLHDRLERLGALPPGEARDVILQVLRGLGEAHASGLVHRDIKPANIFCTGEGAAALVKVLDFGIAKALHDAAVAQPMVPTATGVVVGTPKYLAPEQARGQSVDPRADLYAVACVLYKCLTGRSPFEHHRTMHEILVAHVSERPEAPSKHAPVPLSAELDKIVLKALEKEPAARFDSAMDFAEALGAARLEPDGATRPLVARTEPLLGPPPGMLEAQGPPPELETQKPPPALAAQEPPPALAAQAPPPALEPAHEEAASLGAPRLLVSPRRPQALERRAASATFVFAAIVLLLLATIVAIGGRALVGG